LDAPFDIASYTVRQAIDKMVAELNIQHSKHCWRPKQTRSKSKRFSGFWPKWGQISAGEQDWKQNLIVGSPKTPMRRVYGNALTRLRFNPTIEGTAAGKNQRMQGVAFDDSKLDITVKRRGRNIFPH